MRNSWASEFLAFLGVSGYREKLFSNRDLEGMSTLCFDTLMSAMLSGGGGAMVAAPHFPRGGHWFSILAQRNSEGSMFYLTYDSSQTIPKQLKKQGFPAGKQLGWINGKNFKTFLTSVMKPGGLNTAGFVSKI